MNWSCWQGDCLSVRGWMETWQRTTVLSSPNSVCVLAAVTSTSYSQIGGFVAVITVLYLSISPILTKNIKLFSHVKSVPFILYVVFWNFWSFRSLLMFDNVTNISNNHLLCQVYCAEHFTYTVSFIDNHLIRLVFV